MAEVDRVGDLTRFNVVDVPELAHVSNSKELLTPDEHGWALGHALSLAVEHGQHLWLSEVTPEQLAQLREILGKELVHIASVHDSEDDNTVVVAVSPRQLLYEWADGTPEQIGYLRTVLEGTDPLRVSQHTLSALREAGVSLVPRADVVRLLHNPKFLAYSVVFIYSSLRHCQRLSPQDFVATPSYCGPSTLSPLCPTPGASWRWWRANDAAPASPACWSPSSPS